MAVDHCVWGSNVSPSRSSHHQDDHYSAGTPSSSSTRSSSMTSTFNFADNHAPSPLVASKDSYMDNQAKARLPEMLKSFIIYRCSLNEHCSEMDFDHTALEALSRMPFLQALQTVEHFSASVSSRIQKKSAYLMGILRGQEAHWDKFLIANGLNVVGSNNMETSSLKGRQILEMPTQLLHFIGDCCLRGNSLPSDFTPEVCLSLHNLTVGLATKAVSAFNTNKRIIAGPKGGVINRARFFLRLIQNVSEQSSTSSPSNLIKTQSADVSSTRSKSSDVRSVGGGSNSDNTMSALCAQLAESATIGHPSPKSNTELNLEQLAELDFHFDQGHAMSQTAFSTGNRDDQQRIRMLEDQLAMRQQREELLVLELSETKHRLRFLQTECMKMRSLLGYN